MGRLVATTANEEGERRLRILDSKTRTIGVDQPALEHQVVERRQREAAEKARDNAYAATQLHYADQVSLQQQDAEARRRNWNKEVAAYRQEEQGKATTREWDLNRGDAKRVDSPARLGDGDSRCGPSSLQRFDGEDLSAGDRAAAQMEQCKSWWDRQMDQKAAAAAAEADAKEELAVRVRQQDNLQRSSAAQEASLRTAANAATLQRNQELAGERRAEEARRQASEDRAKADELSASLASAWLTEDPLTATSALSATRVRKDHWKGMSEAEKRAIVEQQRQQVEEKRQRDRQEAWEEVQYARTQNDVLRQLNEQARAVDDFRRQQAERTAEVLRRQAAEKQQREGQLGELYANKISREYFDQFGTSHR